ncbi:hypothetical protein F4803DRAFT_359494 [Xylaria telfairii]|nr:hypothetical protein F4803DRAFT_359494 [Xylaria telfairii]
MDSISGAEPIPRRPIVAYALHSLLALVRLETYFPGIIVVNSRVIDVQKLKNLLTFTGVQGPNREDKEIRMSNTHSFLFRFIQLGEDILKIREPSRYGSRTRAFFNVKESNSGWTDYMLYLVPQGLSGIDMEHPNPRVVLLGLESVNFHGSRRQHDRPPNEAEHVSHRSFADREFEIDLPTHPPTSSITTNSGSSTGSEVSRQPFLEFIAQLADPWAPHSFYLLQQVTCLNGRFSFDEKLGQAMMILWQHLPGSYWISLRFKAPRQRFRRWLHGKVSRLEKYEPGRKRCDIHLENLFYIDTLEMKKFEGPGNGERRLIRLHSFGEQDMM